MQSEIRSQTRFLLTVGLFVLVSAHCFGQNPIIRSAFSADPTARVFGDSVYLYPSHDILATADRGRVGWFCMADYHVYASVRLTDWKDKGVVVSQYNVPWADTAAYSMWAPDCIYRDGKYYFYFPTKARDTTYGRGFSIGVAIADKPYGPFKPLETPIIGVHGIDPNVFIDTDGQAYLYWAEGEIYVAKLKRNMVELASPPQVIAHLPNKGLKEGPYLFKRADKYYLTYPHVANKTERLEYAVSDHPMGPFKVDGVIMEANAHCWTNHQSIIKYKGQWYLFYHSNDYSPDFDKARSVRVDSLFFDTDGSIKEVIPTLRGVGITDGKSEIQIDRYSAISSLGTSVSFLDTADRFEGWKTTLGVGAAEGWIQYNSVDFGKSNLTSLIARVKSTTGGKLQVHLDGVAGPVIAEIRIPATEGWKTVTATVAHFVPGVHNIVVTSSGKAVTELDWLQFK